MSDVEEKEDLAASGPPEAVFDPYFAAAERGAAMIGFIAGGLAAVVLLGISLDGLRHGCGWGCGATRQSHLEREAQRIEAQTEIAAAVEARKAELVSSTAASEDEDRGQ